MSFVVPVSSSSAPAVSPTTTKAQDIVNAVIQDLQFNPFDTDILLDYTSRIQLDLLRVSRWKFLLAAPQHFVTRKEETDYWIGAVGTGPTDAFDTGLNLTDVEFIKEGSVFDRSNFRELSRTDETPLLARLGFADENARPGRPAVWRNAPETPGILNLYPASDNQNIYQPVPGAPTLKTAVSGAQAARTYTVKMTFVDSAGGESAASDSSLLYVPANSVLVVQTPPTQNASSDEGITYNKFNVYVALKGGEEELQNASPISIGTNWQEPNGGLISGVSFPTGTTIAPMGGYLIEFRYFKQRQIVTAGSQVLQVPDIYKPVVIYGVDWLGATFLKRPEEAERWKQMYGAGIISIVRDKNLFPKGDSFIAPDSAALTRTLPSIESFDISRFMLP